MAPEAQKTLALDAFSSFLTLIGDRLVVEGVYLVEDDELGLFAEPAAIGDQFAANCPVVGDHVLGGAVDEMDQGDAALDMTEEAVADAGALVGTLDQAGNIGEHEVAAADPDHAEIGMERGERIVGDLGLGGRHGGEEGRLAGIGQADESGVGNELQPQPDALLDAVLAGIGMAWRLVGRGLEMGVAEAAIAALEEADALADRGQVGDQRLVVLLEHLGALRNAQGHVRPGGAGAVLAHAVGAGAGRKCCW